MEDIPETCPATTDARFPFAEDVVQQVVGSGLSLAIPCPYRKIIAKTGPHKGKSRAESRERVLTMLFQHLDLTMPEAGIQVDRWSSESLKSFFGFRRLSCMYFLASKRTLDYVFCILLRPDHLSSSE